MKHIINAAYEATLKKYHGFIVKKVFSVRKLKHNILYFGFFIIQNIKKKMFLHLPVKEIKKTVKSFWFFFFWQKANYLLCFYGIQYTLNLYSIYLKGVSSFTPYRKDYLLKMALGKEGQEEQVNHSWLIDWCSSSHLRIFHSYWYVTICKWRAKKFKFKRAASILWAERD